MLTESSKFGKNGQAPRLTPEELADYLAREAQGFDIRMGPAPEAAESWTERKARQSMARLNGLAHDVENAVRNLPSREDEHAWLQHLRKRQETLSKEIQLLENDLAQSAFDPAFFAKIGRDVEKVKRDYLDNKIFLDDVNAEIATFDSKPEEDEVGLEQTHIQILPERAAIQEESKTVNSYPCPDHLWMGPLSDIAAALGRTSWEIYLGALTALAAIAHRNIHVQYYGPLYGQFYGLLIKPTGTGKSLCTNTFRALLPDWYSVSGAVQSGPALMPIVATVERSPDGKVVSCSAKQGALIIPEWTRLARNLKIQHSTLQEDLNELADGIAWNISRSDANRTGGGNAMVKDPVLSICATTTEKLFMEEVTTRMIHSGFVNRYLILPGTFQKWNLYDPDAVTLNFAALGKIREKLLSASTFGLGRPIWEMFTPEALARFLEWGTPYFEDGIMNLEEEGVEIYKRLHTSALRNCCIMAWQERAKLIQLSHVDATITVTETSKRYIDSLMAKEAEVEIPKLKQYEMGLERKVMERVKKHPGCSSRNVNRALEGKNAPSGDITQTIQKLLSAGSLIVKHGAGNNPSKHLFCAEDWEATQKEKN